MRIEAHLPPTASLAAPAILCLLAFVSSACTATPAPEKTAELPPPRLVVSTRPPLSTLTAPPPTPTDPLPTEPPPSASATASATPTAPGEVVPVATAGGQSGPAPSTGQATAGPQPTAGATHVFFPPVVMANYLAWYDTGSWSKGCTSDAPAAGPYLSEDPATVARHVAEGQRAGLDGFNVHWISPGDRTDVILAQVLAQGFGAAATFLSHSFTGAARGAVASNLSYIINTYGNQGGYLRLGGRPVIFFVGMPRVDTSGGLTPLQAWAEVRAAADPNHGAIWFAEGLEPEYLDVFDGLYVYKIDHACCPYAYQSAERWQGWVRQAEAASGQQKYWAATLQPGWNDELSTSASCADNRVGVETFSRDRENGEYYRRTFNSAMATRADVLIVNSFNEWVEGSHIEPSAAFGDFYLDLTAQFAAQYRASR